MKFNNHTFKYFDEALKNKFDPDWFEKNKSMYEDNVKAPMEHLVSLLHASVGKDLKKISFNKRKIVNPKVAKNKHQHQGYVKDYTRAYFAQNKTSLYEWNPGIYIQFGSKERDVYFAGGMHEVSSRQIHNFRAAVQEDFMTLDKILKKKGFRASWGEIQSELYKRYPVGYKKDAPYSKYLWMKQFYFSKSPTRTEMKAKNFIENTVKDYKASVEVLKWIIEAVGTYRGKV
jgi:uncharacterized protein (DUF2461 family)